MVETDYGMLFCIGLLFLVCFVHLRLHDFACALVTLTEVSKGSLPTLGSHSNVYGLADCWVEMGFSIFLQIVTKCGLMDHDSGVHCIISKWGTWTCITRVADLDIWCMLDDYSIGLGAVDDWTWLELHDSDWCQVFLESLKRLRLGGSVLLQHIFPLWFNEIELILVLILLFLIFMWLVNHITPRWTLPRNSIFLGHRALEAEGLSSQGLDEDDLARFLQVFDVLAEGLKPWYDISWQD